MIRLLREDQSREVTFITFTRTSRRDTENKLRKAFGEAVLDQPGLLFPRTSTLYTYAKRLVHKFSRLIGRDPSFSILIDEKGERDILIEEVIADLGCPVEREELSKAIAEFRATGEWPPAFSVLDINRIPILERFDELLRLYNTYDIQGLVLAAREILKSSESALPLLFLQVDEYQDLNPADQQFLSFLISHPASEVAIVGDDAQSIYGFRHANYEGLRDLWQSESWERIHFPDSFRLPSHILNAALDHIANRGYLGANIHRKPDNGLRIPVLQCTTPPLQTEAIARDIKARIAAATERGQPLLALKDFLVLCPITIHVEQAVRSFSEDFGIPAHTLSRPSIPDDYWSVLLLLRIAHDSDPLALRQWLPVLGLSTEQIAQLRNAALESGLPFFACCLRAGDHRIDQFQGLVEQLRDEAETPGSLIGALSRISGVQIPPDLTTLLQSATTDDGRLPPIGRLVQFLYEHFRVLDSEELVPDDDRVLVATMHSAKGLEAEFVYCTWMNSTFMPLEGRDPDEERRVLYVALTRAKQGVLLTYPEGYDIVRRRRLGQEIISPFLNDIAPRLNILRTTAAMIRSDPLPWQFERINAT
jgi:DNA helicase-2/ATP-dependent DNA helicase PcrA